MAFSAEILIRGNFCKWVRIFRKNRIGLGLNILAWIRSVKTLGVSINRAARLSYLKMRFCPVEKGPLEQTFHGLGELSEVIEKL